MIKKVTRVSGNTDIILGEKCPRCGAHRINSIESRETSRARIFDHFCENCGYKSTKYEMKG